HVPPQWFAPPGNQDYRSLLAANRNPVRRAEDPKTLRYKDFVNKGYVIAGSPATVRERLVEEVIKRLHVGNLMLLIQIGSMPHELTLKNTELLAREVLPGLREIWDDKGWENHWWPRSLRGARQPVGAARCRPTPPPLPPSPLGGEGGVRGPAPSPSGTTASPS